MAGTFNVTDFDLAGTLTCGQAFRWSAQPDGWFEGVVGQAVWQLRQRGAVVEWEMVQAPGSARVSRPRRQPDRQVSVLTNGRPRSAVGATCGVGDPRTAESSPSSIAHPPSVLLRYLSLDRSLPDLLATFPDDPHLRAAVVQHRGLRVLRQEPWETLASFIASSTKQIVQIRQIVAELARRFGEPLGHDQYAFPAVDVIARCTHDQLWDCKLGFRAKNLLAAARAVDSGECDLAGLCQMEFGRALEELDKLPGVGEKIALCTMLFGCGFDQAFPIDVWVERSLRRLYFPDEKKSSRELREFTRNYFGPHAGWAQQYLFFAERVRGRTSPQPRGTVTRAAPPERNA